MSARAYYNEFDPYAAQWLRNLIAAGLIPAGDVDERSVTDVQPSDLDGYTQAHFFAGIGGWPYALRLAGWPDDQPVWTGSCPCQPFSVAGKGKGTADERHLWPAFRRLISERSPAVVFGEQVASADGRLWLAGVRADLEGMGYAVGAADLCAASVGAPHIRQRLFWVADAGRGIVRDQRFAMDGATGTGEGQEDQRQRIRSDVGDGIAVGGLGHANRRESEAGLPEPPQWEEGHTGKPLHAGRPRGTWATAVWLPCLDGKARRIEPSVKPLVNGVPARVGRLRAYGNAIVPEVAAGFIAAYLDVALSTSEAAA